MKYTYSTDTHFEYPHCGEPYMVSRFHPGVEQFSCDGQDGCGKDFTVAFMDVNKDDLISFTEADLTPAMKKAVDLLKSDGVMIEVWGIDPLEISVKQM